MSWAGSGPSTLPSWRIPESVPCRCRAVPCYTGPGRVGPGMATPLLPNRTYYLLEGDGCHGD